MAKKNLKKLLEEAISNIREDRKISGVLLEDAAEYIGSNQERHREAGLVAAKYLEVLQRSNEQLVKIVALMKDDDEEGFGDLDSQDKSDLYDDLENQGKKTDG